MIYFAYFVAGRITYIEIYFTEISYIYIYFYQFKVICQTHIG